MNKPNTVMVLAAGLGTRMRPLTETTPKPLIEVAGATLLDHALAAAKDAGITRAVVNVHYLADQIEDHLATLDIETLVSDERARLLDSGGGIAYALPLIGTDPFLILNADTFWREPAAPGNLDAMAAHLDDDADIVLMLVPHERAVGFAGRGDFFLDDRRLRRRGEADAAPYIYAGAILARPHLFEGYPETFSLNAVFDKAIASGRARGTVMDGLWLHVGTPDAIGEAEAALAR